MKRDFCVNEREVKDRARERMYVGMSRATDRLIVVGDPAVIQEMGGPEAARKPQDRRSRWAT